MTVQINRFSIEINGPSHSNRDRNVSDDNFTVGPEDAFVVQSMHVRQFRQGASTSEGVKLCIELQTPHIHGVMRIEELLQLVIFYLALKDEGSDFAVG